MTRHWAAALLASAAVLAAAPAAHGATLDRSAAAKKALAALDAREGDDALIVFGLRRTVEEGTRITQAGPTAAPLSVGSSRVSTRLARAGVKAIAAGRVMIAGEESWLFYADQGPSLAFEHPGRVVLVGASSGKVRLSRPLRWVPLVDGRVPEFFTSPDDYASDDFRVFDRPWKVRARAAKAKARAAATTPEVDAAQRRLADALAAERSCAVRVSDTLGDFYDFGRVDKTRASLGRIFKNLSQLNAGFVTQRYTLGAGRTPIQAAQRLIDAGCRDLLLYAAGSARRTGQAGIGVGLRPRGTRAIQWHTLTAAAIERLIRANRGVTFKLAFDASFSGRIAQRLSDEPNVSVLLTSGDADDPSFTYLPQIVGGSGIVRNPSNPFRLLEFTNSIIGGLERFVTLPVEIDHAIAEQAAGRSDSVLAWMLARSLDLGPSPFSSMLLGRPNQRVPFTSASRLPVGAPANRAPNPTTPTTFTTAEDTPRAITLSGTDPDGDPITFAVTAQPTRGVLSGVAPNLTYTPARDFNGTDQLTYRVSDNRGGGASETISVRVTPDNDSAAVIAGGGVTPTSYTEQAAPVAVDTGLTVTDVDSTSLVSATVEIAAGFVAGDALAADLTGLPAITGTYDSGTGVLTLTGPATLAEYQQALRSVSFASSSDDPGPTRTVRFRGFDGDAIGVPATRDIAITQVNDAPVNSVPSSKSTNEDTTLTLSGADKLSIADADARSDAVQVTLTGTNGNLTIDSTSGLSFATGDGTNDPAMTFTGSQSAINAAIDVVRFIPDANYNGAGGQIEIVTDDQGNNPGGALSDTDTVDVTVNAVNDAPTQTVPGAQTLNEGGNVTLLGAFSIADVDAGTADLVTTVGLTAAAVDVDDTSTATIAGDNSSSVQITGTVAEINDALDNVTVTPDTETNDATHPSRAITLTTDDQGNTPGPTARTDSDSVPLTVDPVNDAPVIDPPNGTPMPNEDTTLAFTGSNAISVSDVDAAENAGTADDLDVDLTIPAGRLSVGVAPSGVTVTGNDTGALSVSGPEAGVNAALADLTWTPATNDGAGRTLSITASDLGNNGSGGPLTDTEDALIDVTAVNDAPLVTTTAGTVAYTEGDPATQIDGGLELGDVDDTELASATVTISGFQLGDDLDFTAPAGITGTYDSGTGVLTLTPTGLATSAPLADFQTALRSVAFLTTTDDPTTSRMIQFVVNDGDANSAAKTRSVVITPVNDAPTVDTSAGTASFTEDDTTGVVVDPAVTVADPDDANIESATVQITTNRDAATDVLTFTDQNNIAGEFTAANGTLELTGTSSKANYEAALRSIRFKATGDNPSDATRTVVFKVNDGTADSATDSRDVTVTRTNDAPAVDTSSGQAAYTEAGAAAIVDPAIQVSDPDDTTLESATVSITSGHQSADRLSIGGPAPSGVTVQYTAATGVLEITGTKTVAEYEAILRSVAYHNEGISPGASRTVTFRVNDGDANSPATNETRNVDITNVNDKPVIGSLSGTVAYAENDPATQLDADATVSDTDSANLTGGTVTIAGGTFRAQDELTFTDEGPVTGSYNSGTGVLTISGTGTLAQYQTFIRSVGFRTTDDTPETHTRTVEFQVTDGEPSNGTSDIATKSVTVTAANDAPVVTTTGGAASYTEDASPTVVDSGVTVTDADDTELASATVAIANVQTGDQLHFTDTTEIDGTFAAGTLTLLPQSGQAPTVAHFQAALRSVSYSSTSQNPSETPRTINFSVNDGDVTSAAASKTMNVDAINDSPALTANDAGTLTYTEDTPGENHTLAIVPGLGVADGDDANLTGASVQFTAGFSSSEDRLSFVNQNGITGTYDTGTGVLTLTGSSSVANYQTALRSVAYQNLSDDPSTTQRTVSFQATDGHTGESPLSNTVNRNIDVVRTNDAPTPDPDTFQNASETVGNTSLVVDDPTDGAPDPTGPQKTVAGDILGNDDDPDTPANELSVTPETDKVTTNGGRFTVQDDGDFTYTPPAGCDHATDTVQYQVEDNHPTDEQTETATLTFHIAQCVWYVDPDVTGPGDGRSHNPYKTLGQLNNSASDQDQTGERLFLYGGTHTSVNPSNAAARFALENDQSLHTEKHGLVVGAGTGQPGNLALESPNPSATTTIVNGLTLASGNAVQGLNLGNTATTAEAALSGSNVGTVGFNDVTPGSIDNQNGGAVDISGSGTMSMEFDKVASNNATGDAIRLDSTSGSFTTTSTSTGADNTLQNAGEQSVQLSDNPAVTGASTVTFNFNGRINDSSGSVPAVTITDQSGGSRDFNGSLTTTGGGINMATVTGTTRFDGQVQLSTGAQHGISASSAGTLAIPGSAGTSNPTTNTLSATTGTPLSVSNTTIHSDDLRFQSISSNGANRGILLDTTGNAGNLQVTGTTGTCQNGNTVGCSGGAILNSSGADQTSATPGGSGIVLNSTSNPSFTRMHIQHSSNFGIRGEDVDGFSLTNSVVNGNHGNAQGGLGSGQEGSIRMEDLTGSASVTGSYVSGGANGNLDVHNDVAGTLNRLTLQSNTFGHNQAAGSNSVNLNVPAAVAATLNATVDDNVFTGAAANPFLYTNAGTSNGDLVFTDNTITNSHPNQVTGANSVGVQGGQGGGTTTIDVSRNTMQGAKSDGMIINKSNGPGTVDGTINANNIGVAGTSLSGSREGRGLTVETRGGGELDVDVTNNDIRQYFSFGMNFQAGLGTVSGGQMNLLISGNTVANPANDLAQSGLPVHGVQIVSGNISGDTHQVCVDLGPNSITGSHQLNGTGVDLRVRQRFGTRFKLISPSGGYLGSPGDGMAAAAFAANEVGGLPTHSGSAEAAPPPGTGFVGGTTCP